MKTYNITDVPQGELTSARLVVREGDSVHLYFHGDELPYYEVSSVVPKIVSRRQFKLAALQLGLLSTIEAAVAQSTTEVQISYMDATEFVSTDPVLLSMAQTIGKSKAEIDALFDLAAAL